MLPNEFSYYIFLAFVLLALLVLKSRHAQTVLLLAASYFLYIYSNSYYIFSIVFVTVLTFYCGHFIFSNKNKKVYLALALIGSLGQLSLFKFSGFLTSRDFSYFMFTGLGISYYTFMALSYVFDIYRGKMQPSDSFIEYALFVSFFPVVTSGPIIRAKDFLAQLKTSFKISSDNLQPGLTLICAGLVMKLVIADNIAGYVDPIFSAPTTFGSRDIILATLAFGVQLYCDFAGYSDVALGIARLLGFRFPMNFNNPYFAVSPTDFWHRWNISLSSFLRDYVYISLGGNRRGEYRTNINLIITMILCGLWHGATWNFLIWGAFHGSLLTLNRFIRVPNSKALFLTKILLTQYFVFLGWLIFKVNNLDNLIYCLHKFIIPTGFGYTSFVIGVIIVSLLLLFRDRIANNDWLGHISSARPIYWFVYVTLAINLIYWFSPMKVTKFIYAGF
jgi:alginate O-acetyltransferase complex protein AlgI